MNTIKQLHDLQEIDLRTEELETSLTNVRVKLADESPIISAKQEAAQLELRLEAINTNRRTAERTISDLQEKLQKVETRLYGGEIKNPRELEATEEERSFIGDQQREQEDALLEIMVVADEAESGFRKSHETLERLENARPNEVAELKETETSLSEELTSLRKDRERMAPTLEANQYRTYESLRKSKNGRAVAKVERGTCQGCRLTLSTMELQRTRSAQGIVQCSSCRRILYVV